MEGTVGMTSNASNNTAAALAPNHQQAAVVVSSLTGTEQAANNIANPRPPVPCPRCFSTNTKFCYYNNYNLTQPRYNCKACRRYWTQGGSLRHVPIGGGCRRSRASSTAATSAEVDNAVSATLMLSNQATEATMTNTTMAMPSPTGIIAMSSVISSATPLLPNDMLPAFAPPTGGSGADFNIDLAMDELQLQDFRRFELEPLPWTMAPGGSEVDAPPTFLGMMPGGYFDFGGSSNSHGDATGLAMNGGYYGMDNMTFLLPEIGAPENDVLPGTFQWTPSELESFINEDGGYAIEPTARVEKKQQEEDANNAAENGANNNGEGAEE